MSEQTDTPLPRRLVILRRVSEVLEQCRHDGSTMEGRVFRGRVVYGDNDPIPMISLLEPPIPLETMISRADNPHSAGKWELLVQGFVHDDDQNPTDPAHMLMAEAKHFLNIEKKRERGNNPFGLGGMVTSVSIGQGSVRPPDEVSNKAFFWLVLTLGIVENLDDPYA